MCCGCGLSLRTSTYFWTFMHVFLAVVFLLICGLESFKFSRPDSEQGFLIYVSAQVVVERSQLYLLWGYGIVYFVCGLMIFHGVHKEFPSLIRWTLFLFVIIQLCSVGLLRSILRKRMAYSSRTTDFMDSVTATFQTSLIVFFIIIQLIHSIFYVIDTLIYAYVLAKSNLIVQKIVYV